MKAQGRRLLNSIMMGLCLFATALGLLALAWILLTLLVKGFGAMNLKVFTEITPPANQEGGLSNAIVGSLALTFIAVLIGTPIGILAATYLAEYGRRSRISSVVRFVSDILLSAPSIVTGLFVYEIVVTTMGHFSGLAGAIALAIIVIPIVLRTTEDMLRLVPDAMREAAASIGAPRWVGIRHVIYRAARAGMITGILLAVARVSGETAPLIFTAFGNNFFSTDVTGPIATLPVTIFQFALSPYDNWKELAWVGALLITLAVLALSVTARVFAARQERS